MTIKINKLEFENVKRIKAVVLEPEENGLTVIGGENQQGKSSVLDAIAWALGGNKFKPSKPQREGSVVAPQLHVELSNGLIVEREGVNSTLKVTDPSGQKAGQRLLDSFISELALNLPKFMEANNKEKADTLLKIIGVGDELDRLEKEEKAFYEQRRTIGQIRDRKKASAAEMEYYPEVERDEVLSISDLIKEQQVILAKNGENQRQRDNLKNLLKEKEFKNLEYEQIEKKIEELLKRKTKLKLEIEKDDEIIISATKSVEELQDESTEELERSIKNIEELNAKIGVNQKKNEALKEAAKLDTEYKDLTEAIESVREKKTELLNKADLPLKELGIEEGELTYKGQKWDCMSGSERLKVSASIVRRLNPDCGFVLLDKLEQFDKKNLEEFNTWAEAENLQVIATRVSNGEECTIIIEDGYSEVLKFKEKEEAKKWEAGVF